LVHVVYIRGQIHQLLKKTKNIFLLIRLIRGCWFSWEWLG